MFLDHGVKGFRAHGLHRRLSTVCTVEPIDSSTELPQAQAIDFSG